MNKYRVKIKTIGEMSEDNSDDINSDPDLKEMFEKYGGTVQKVYRYEPDSDIYYSDKVLNDESLSLVKSDRHFFKEELVFMGISINIKLKDDLFEMK